MGLNLGQPRANKVTLDFESPPQVKLPCMQKKNASFAMVGASWETIWRVDLRE